MNENTYVIGIDGGGTKTHALLASIDGSVLSEAHANGANPQIIGFDKSAKTLFNLIRECCGKIKQPVKSVRSIVAGIAGVGRSADKAHLKEELFALSVKSRNILIEHDARIALEAALPWRAGIVLISGTGSIAFYRTKANQFLRSGGWGRVLGDDGSGFAIAREALRTVMLQYEGRAEETILTHKALEFFKVESVDHIVSAIRKLGGEIAPFVPAVFEAADLNDSTALRILDSNASQLMELIQTLLQQAPSTERITIAFEGGLLENENVYSRMVRKKLREKYPHLYIQKPKFPPVYGALILALHPFKLGDENE